MHSSSNFVEAWHNSGIPNFDNVLPFFTDQLSSTVVQRYERLVFSNSVLYAFMFIFILC